MFVDSRLWYWSLKFSCWNIVLILGISRIFCLAHQIHWKFPFEIFPLRQREKNGILLGSIRWECEIWWRKLAVSSCAFDETALTHCHRPNSHPTKTLSYVKSYFQASQQACFCSIPTMLNLHPIGTIHYWQEFCPLVVHTRKRHYQYCCRLHFEVLGGNNMPATTRILSVYHHHDCI